ncbi:hypothetical protein [Streptomyces sp. SLBN-31]|jgi:hypothetical protein|uniref:hypothetical protein n=1 Tax=Streptomyces sp. SLBN-31 TaxID=2768444 RepID=UPI001151093B|nr:hypothetical protein [Streptomyces sp. SLBN-31]TQJ87405.1 hypothetical protein FBY22_6244 [Streptomyces sp. SLBN-31]
MRTGGATRPGLVFGFGLALAVVTAGLCAGCGDPGSAGGSTAGRTTASTPAAATTSPEDLCTRVVAHWSREVLDSHSYGDYQTMGLSNGQYDILREVVDAARVEKKKHGARAADELIGREARAGCRDWYRTGGPSNGPWS